MLISEFIQQLQDLCDNEDDIWEVSLFGYKDELYYRCDNGIPWIQCIPYDGNEHLLGTTNNVEG